MRFHALAADYDGTLATHGQVDDATYDALRRLRASGRKVVLVTGRELDDLFALISDLSLFDRIVAENGAVVYHPETRETRNVAQPPPPEFADELRRRGADRVRVGHVIVATWEPYQQLALDVIRELGLELQVIFNKGAVMVLPTGINKATGLAIALGELGLSPHNVVAVGDAENDHAMLEYAECGAAVANSLPALVQHADIVLTRDHGAGVCELIEHMLANDLDDIRPARRRARLGRRGDRDVEFDPCGPNILVCGSSGSGKSTLTTAIVEGLAQSCYQIVVLDPEGDYAELEFAVALGSLDRAPLVKEVLDVLRDPGKHVSVNLLAVPLQQRPEFAGTLLAALGELNARTGRPHWIVVDEAHHLLPASWKPADDAPPRSRGVLYVTVHPESVAPVALATVGIALAVGEDPNGRLTDLARLTERATPSAPVVAKLAPGRALMWRTDERDALEIEAARPHHELRRHSRKYSEGNLGRERSFYFRGPDGKLNLKASNLMLFVELADGIDDETWLYHLGRGDYSTWLRTQVKDGVLADEVARLERQAGSAADSRREIRAAIEARYTLPADQPTGIVDAPDRQRGHG